MLPIFEALPALKAALNAREAAVLVAPPGAGKTTAVPLALLDEPWVEGRKLIVLEPRRFESREVLAGFVRRQLWIDPSGEKEARFQAALDDIALEDGGGWTLRGRGETTVGVVTWTPPHHGSG